MADVVLSVLAHPDDAEFLCAGTLIRLAREHGWQVHIASMTPGDCGSAEHAVPTRSPASAAGRRRGRRRHRRDLSLPRRTRPADLLSRAAAGAHHSPAAQVRPRMVLTHSPADYMLDHEMTSTLVRAAAFARRPPTSSRLTAMPPAASQISPSVLLRCHRGQGRSGPARSSRLPHRRQRRDREQGRHAGRPRQPARLAAQASRHGPVPAVDARLERARAGRPASPSPRVSASTSATAIPRTICSARCLVSAKGASKNYFG